MAVAITVHAAEANKSAASLRTESRVAVAPMPFDKQRTEPQTKESGTKEQGQTSAEKEAAETTTRIDTSTATNTITAASSSTQQAKPSKKGMAKRLIYIAATIASLVLLLPVAAVVVNIALFVFYLSRPVSYAVGLLSIAPLVYILSGPVQRAFSGIWDDVFTKHPVSTPNSSLSGI